MITKTVMTLSGIDVHVERKSIKNLHLAIYPPDGRVRISVPKYMTDDNVRLAITEKLGWIKRKQQTLLDQPAQPKRQQYISGEFHYYFGQRCCLELIHSDDKPEVTLFTSGKLKLSVRSGTSVENKEKILNTWYRKELKKIIPKLLDKWQPIIGKNVQEWGVKKMKTRWGSCNIIQRRIWLNLDLAKKPPECLEYVLVHELTHLHERHHNERFRRFMDQFLPHWRTSEKTLNTAPLADDISDIPKHESS